MSTISLSIIAILYAISAIDQAVKKDYVLAFISLCYAASVLGFVWLNVTRGNQEH